MEGKGRKALDRLRKKSEAAGNPCSHVPQRNAMFMEGIGMWPLHGSIEPGT